MALYAHLTPWCEAPVSILSHKCQTGTHACNPQFLSSSGGVPSIYAFSYWHLAGSLTLCMDTGPPVPLLHRNPCLYINMMHIPNRTCHTPAKYEGNHFRSRAWTSPVVIPFISLAFTQVLEAGRPCRPSHHVSRQSTEGMLHVCRAAVPDMNIGVA